MILDPKNVKEFQARSLRSLAQLHLNCLDIGAVSVVCYQSHHAVDNARETVTLMM